MKAPQNIEKVKEIEYNGKIIKDAQVNCYTMKGDRFLIDGITAIELKQNYSTDLGVCNYYNINIL